MFTEEIKKVVSRLWRSITFQVLKIGNSHQLLFAFFIRTCRWKRIVCIFRFIKKNLLELIFRNSWLWFDSKCFPIYTDVPLLVLNIAWLINSLKMASRETICRSYECLPRLSLFVCVKNDSSKERFLEWKI